ncbi:uncharacterized protein LOC116294704 [Actinia tenebrosa]|uniref:Uncharacterized protein LOC116294704 n=1 Tax=Actinia tenebrosa TaxID=6105 RepID=A0A6P8I027_ACTTE|nr:uncharacterized protein LOC116294704 [Actinia tenebrosa]
MSGLSGRDDTDSPSSQRSRRNILSRFVPRMMLSQSVNRQEPQINELENTCSSSRSSFAELWDSSIPIEIRDGSAQKGSVFNPTSAVLHMCNRQVMAPYFFMLSIIGWRPLFRESRKFRRIFQGLNALFTLTIMLLLVFSYVASIIACQSRLDVMQATITPTSTSLPPTTHKKIITTLPTTAPNSTHNATTAVPSTVETPTSSLSTSSDHSTASSYFTFKMFTLGPAKPEWRPTECTHLFSGYIVPDLLHFAAFIFGFYHFRIQESEGLQALIEMVFLQSRNQTKVVKRLRSFLILGAVCLVISTATYILFIISFGLPSVTGFHNDTKNQWISICFMVLGNLVLDCVSFVVILNYCAQCQLLIFYLRDIALRMEEKTAELGHTMKVTQNLS